MLNCDHCGERHPASERYCPTTGKILAPERFFPLGTMIGKYRLERVLGAGGMGAVFVGTHTMLNKQVALKLMLPELSSDREAVGRAVREAQAASATGHRNVTLVTDMGWMPSGAIYIVMELLEGRTLGEIVAADGPLPIGRAVGLTRQLLAGLAAVHRRNIVHRDLKPDNLMVVEDDEGAELLKILDFGISKFVDHEMRLKLTTTGRVVGTPHYMSPEQARGLDQIDGRADIYAAGGVLYTLLTGGPPLDAPGYNAMIVRILEGRIDAPSRRVAGVPAALDAAVLKAMSQQREDRFGDAQAFAEALAPFVSLAPPAVTGEQGGIDRLSLVGLDRRADGAEPEQPRELPELDPTLADDLADEQVAGPSAEVADDSRFAPPAEAESSLELELPALAPAARARVTAEQSPLRRPSGTMHEVRPQRFTLPRPLLQGLVLAALLGLGWLLFGETIVGWLAPREAKTATVRVTVQTAPPDAEIYLDGVLQVRRPIELERSEREFNLRVHARGYRSQSFIVKADRDQLLEVRLKKRPGKRD